MPISFSPSAHLHLLLIAAHNHSQHIASLAALLFGSFLLSFCSIGVMSLSIAHRPLIQAIACVLAGKRYQKRWFGLDALSDFCDEFAPTGLVTTCTTITNEK